jgi:hypothetical protein
VALLLPRAADADSHVGREFWTGWPRTPDVTPADPDYDLDAELVIVSASGASVTVNVEAPGVSTTVVARAGFPARVRLPRGAAMVVTEDAPVAQAIHAWTDGCEAFGALLRVPGSEASVGDDVMRLMPASLLGLRYLPVAYWGEAEVLVVATDDDTVVTLSDPTCPAPSPFVLDRGEVVLHRCVEASGDADITGTVVEATEPVAVISASAASRIIHHQRDIGPAMTRVFWNYADVLLESTWPEDLLGRVHAHAPFRKADPLASGDLLRVVAACADTSVDARESDGDLWLLDLLRATDHADLEESLGLSVRRKLVDRATVVRSDRPVQVAGYTVGNSDAGMGDPSMLVLDPAERWERGALAFLPKGYTHSLAIIAPVAAVGSVRIDGEAVYGTWNRVGDGRDFRYVRLDGLPSGEYRVTCDEPIFVEVSGYLPDNTEGAYSYPAIAVRPDALPPVHLKRARTCDPGCPGECVWLEAPNAATYDWSTGETTPRIVTCPDETTEVTVTVTDAAGCASVGRTFVEVWGGLAAPMVTGPSEACEGECVTLTSSWGTSYLWDDGSTDRTLVACPGAEEAFGVTVTNALGCRARAEHVVGVVAPPRLGAARVTASGPCRASLVVTWDAATWRPGSPGGVYNVYRLDGECAPDDDATWSLVAAGLVSTRYEDVAVAPGAAHAYLVEAEDAAASVPCWPGPTLGGPTARTCAWAVATSGEDPVEDLVSLSPWLRGTGYDREAPGGRATGATFAWIGAPAVASGTHLEVWRGDRADLLLPVAVDVRDTTWRDAGAHVAPLLFYSVHNATECGTRAD